MATATVLIYKNTVRIKRGSILLVFVTSGLNLHSSLFIETHFNALQLKTDIATTKTFFNNSKNFIWYHSFSLTTCECLVYHQLQ